MFTLSSSTRMRTFFTSMLILFLAQILSGCSGSSKLFNPIGDKAPTVVRSVDDLPRPSTSVKDIAKTGYIRVIEESAEDVSHYDGLKASKAIAQTKLLGMVEGVRIAANMEVTAGTLKEDSVKTLIEGSIKAYDCGSYYDSTKKVGYSCMEIPVR